MCGLARCVDWCVVSSVLANGVAVIGMVWLWVTL